MPNSRGTLLHMTRPKLRLAAEHARYFAQNTLRFAAEFVEDQWFDRTRHVQTSGEVSLKAAGIGREQQSDSEAYQPARPHHIRQVLRLIQANGLSAFNYIDFGSGKGRSLLIAAEHPFRQITGVEFSPALHAQSMQNIQSFRPAQSGSHNITALHANAMDYVFPEGKLVLYLFNPFGASTMQRVLDNLQASLDRDPRHVIILLLWPRCQHLVAAMPGMHRTHKAREYEIYEANAPGADQ